MRHKTQVFYGERVFDWIYKHCPAWVYIVAIIAAIAALWFL